MTDRIPSMVAATEAGEIIDHQRLKMAVWDGVAIRLPEPEELIPLPDGSDLFTMPDRIPVGFSGKRNHLVEYEGEEAVGQVQAVSAFLAPAYLRLAHPAYQMLEQARILPLFAYAPLGWMDGRFWTAGVRIDPEQRQDPGLFNLKQIRRKVEAEMSAGRDNTLLRQLRRCALEYQCRAAQNYFLGRWEAPLPTATHCNASCVGCISHQDGDIPATQERLKRPPEAKDVVEVVNTHFDRVSRPVASFGQGCEGEPLTRASLLLEIVKGVRSKRGDGTMNLNSNASLPDAVDELFAAGLNSIRVSANSLRSDEYASYHRPKGYSFNDVIESIRRAKSRDGFVSLNLLVFPGFTDREDEISALEEVIASEGVDMIQWRNLNIDPQFYLDTVGYTESSQGGPSVGMLKMINRIKERFPDLRHGYFNPALAD